MSLQRIIYKSEIFSRTDENNEKWAKKSHTGEEPIADINMEIIGEVNPQLITSCSDLCDSRNNRFPLIYEYMWNLGITGHKFDWLSSLDDDAVLVQIIIQINQSQFTSKEIFATLEYLPPTLNIKEKPNIFSKIATGARVAGEAAGAVKVIPDPTLDLLGSLGVFVSNVIPTDSQDGTQQCKWYLNKFDYPTHLSSDLAYGIEWHISRQLIQEIGSRIAGRLGIIFIHAPIQNDQEVSNDDHLLLFGKFGLKTKAPQGKFYDFSMLPHARSLGELQLKICPKLSN